MRADAANQPDVFGVRATYSQALVEDGSLSPRLEELAVVAISAANDCEYCVQSHSAVLTEQVGVDPEAIAALEAVGFDHGEIVELTVTCASAVAVNTFADALTVHSADSAGES